MPRSCAKCSRKHLSTTSSVYPPLPTSCAHSKSLAGAPRPAFKAAVFMEGVEKLSDLKPGMILEGAVTNVAAFGAFVDIGVHQDGLVHISAMSKTFVKDPRQVVKPGDIVRVKVLEVDEARKRIALTLRLDDEIGPRAERTGAA